MRTARAIAWTAGLLAWVALGACDYQGIDVQTYSVTRVSTDTPQVDANGTFTTPIVLVVEVGSQAVIGASLKYAASAGDLSVASGVSGAAGMASVTWTVTSAQYAGLADLTFSVCADNQDPPVCTPSVLLTIHRN
jgi:hypothetical protein